MKVISPITITDAILTASNVAEDDYSEWDVSTTYSEGGNAISTTTHRIYESVVAGNIGNDPATDDGTKWIDISATNRWRAFDKTISDQVSKAGAITYSFTPNTLITGVALLGLDAAEVRIEVYDLSSPAEKVFDSTISLVDTGEIIDYFSFFTTDLTRYDTEALIDGLPGYSGYQVGITVGDGSGTAKVGQIVLGRSVGLGDSLEGTSIGMTDFSIKDQNEFGVLSIIERGFADNVSFQFSFPTNDARRVKRVLTDLRAIPAVYFASTDITSYGASVFGYFEEFDIPLSAGDVSFATLEIKGLI